MLQDRATHRPLTNALAVGVVLCVLTTGPAACIEDTADEAASPLTDGFTDNAPDMGPGGFVDSGNNDNPDDNNNNNGVAESCGDGALDASEVCDGDNLSGQDCGTLGLGEGQLTCTDRCTFDVAGCTDPEARSVCGDGVLDEDEACDPGALGQTCADLDGFDGGSLACTSECQLDTAACTACGDGSAEGDEVCDGQDMRGATCESVSPARPFGNLVCNGCQLDASGCEDFQDNDGDGVANAEDPAVDDFTICGDTDNDGCDDCSLMGRSAPEQDGLDVDEDGQCELPLDYECINGENAGQDPNRLDACIMLTHVNADRAQYAQESNGAAPVSWSEEIWAVAIAHSKDMCNRGFFDHTNPDGDGPGDRAAASGLDFGFAENIAVNFDAGAAQYAFMNEPTCVGHRGNVLNPKMTEVGIGYHVCNRDTDAYRWGQHHHVTQNFRMTFSIDASPFCERASTHCEVPPDPPTTATCPDQLVEWGFCPAPTSAMLPQWGCADD